MSKSLKRHEGYLVIDHSASPGIPADVARLIGLDPAAVAEGKVLEAATLTCKHCSNVWKKNQYRIRPRAYCRKCDHYICDACDAEAARSDYVHRCKEEILDAAMTSASRGELFDPQSPKSTTIIVP